MANINGTTYADNRLLTAKEIADNFVAGDGVENVVAITESAYAALETKDSATLYLVVPND